MSSYIKKTSSDFFVPTERTGKVLAAGLRFLPDALFCFPMDREGNIVDVKVEGCILSEMREMLAAIAPWVRDGSYLSLFSDDGSRWRWVFQQGRCREIPAEFRWPDASELSTLPREQDQVVILVEEGKVTDILSSDPRIAGGGDRPGRRRGIPAGASLSGVGILPQNVSSNLRTKRRRSAPWVRMNLRKRNGGWESITGPGSPDRNPVLRSCGL